MDSKPLSRINKEKLKKMMKKIKIQIKLIKIAIKRKILICVKNKFAITQQKIKINPTLTQTIIKQINNKKFPSNKYKPQIQLNYNPTHQIMIKFKIPHLIFLREIK